MSSAALRSRLAAVLGLAVLAPLVSTSADTATRSDDVYCIPPTAEGTCVPADETADEIVGQPLDACFVDEVVDEGVLDEATGDCCYPVLVVCEDTMQSCGCYGRPLVVDGIVRTAGSEARTDWRDEGRAPGPVAEIHRAHLVRFWLENAEAEHSSVAGFAKFVLDLLAVGAPAELVARAQAAGAEELEHTLACYTLASAYAGAPLGPRRMTTPPLVPATDVIALAVSTAREGCIGETVAAHLAAAIAERATDPVVRAVMAQIAEEEARHAELAWETLAWAIEVGGVAVRDAIAPVFAEPLRLPAAATVADHPVLRAHGLLPASEQAAICRRGHAEVVGPVVQALLARRAA